MAVLGAFVDERLTSIIDLFTKEDGRITSAGEFLGNEDQLRCLLKPLIAAGNLIQIDIQTIPYIEAVMKFDGGWALINLKTLELSCIIVYLMRQ